MADLDPPTVPLSESQQVRQSLDLLHCSDDEISALHKLESREFLVRHGIDPLSMAAFGILRIPGFWSLAEVQRRDWERRKSSRDSLAKAARKDQDPHPGKRAALKTPPAEQHCQTCGAVIPRLPGRRGRLPSRCAACKPPVQPRPKRERVVIERERQCIERGCEQIVHAEPSGYLPLRCAEHVAQVVSTASSPGESLRSDPGGLSGDPDGPSPAAGVFAPAFAGVPVFD